MHLFLSQVMKIYKINQLKLLLDHLNLLEYKDKGPSFPRTNSFLHEMALQNVIYFLHLIDGSKYTTPKHSYAVMKTITEQ